MTFPDFSAETIRKAHELVRRRLIVMDPESPHIWWVTSLRGSREYRVQEDVKWSDGKYTMTWMTCTCPHGRNAGAGQPHCYHCAGVLFGYLTRQKLAGKRAVDRR